MNIPPLFYSPSPEYPVARRCQFSRRSQGYYGEVGSGLHLRRSGYGALTKADGASATCYRDEWRGEPRRSSLERRRVGFGEFRFDTLQFTAGSFIMLEPYEKVMGLYVRLQHRISRIQPIINILCKVSKVPLGKLSPSFSFDV